MTMVTCGFDLDALVGKSLASEDFALIIFATIPGTFLQGFVEFGVEDCPSSTPSPTTTTTTPSVCSSRKRVELPGETQVGPQSGSVFELISAAGSRLSPPGVVETRIDFQTNIPCCADGDISAGVVIDGERDDSLELYVESQDQTVDIELFPLTISAATDSSTINYTGTSEVAKGLPNRPNANFNRTSFLAFPISNEFSLLSLSMFFRFADALVGKSLASEDFALIILATIPGTFLQGFVEFGVEDCPSSTPSPTTTTTTTTSLPSDSGLLNHPKGDVRRFVRPFDHPFSIFFPFMLLFFIFFFFFFIFFFFFLFVFFFFFFFFLFVFFFFFFFFFFFVGVNEIFGGSDAPSKTIDPVDTNIRFEIDIPCCANGTLIVRVLIRGPGPPDETLQLSVQSLDETVRVELLDPVARPINTSEPEGGLFEYTQMMDVTGNGSPGDFGFISLQKGSAGNLVGYSLASKTFVLIIRTRQRGTFLEGSVEFGVKDCESPSICRQPLAMSPVSTSFALWQQDLDFEVYQNFSSCCLSPPPPESIFGDTAAVHQLEILGRVPKQRFLNMREASIILIEFSLSKDGGSEQVLSYAQIRKQDFGFVPISEENVSLQFFMQTKPFNGERVNGTWKLAMRMSSESLDPPELEFGPGGLEIAPDGLTFIPFTLDCPDFVEIPDPDIDCALEDLELELDGAQLGPTLFPALAFNTFWFRYTSSCCVDSLNSVLVRTRNQDPANALGLAVDRDEVPLIRAEPFVAGLYQNIYEDREGDLEGREVNEPWRITFKSSGTMQIAEDPAFEVDLLECPQVCTTPSTFAQAPESVGVRVGPRLEWKDSTMESTFIEFEVESPCCFQQNTGVPVLDDASITFELFVDSAAFDENFLMSLEDPSGNQMELTSNLDESGCTGTTCKYVAFAGRFAFAGQAINGLWQGTFRTSQPGEIIQASPGDATKELSEGGLPTIDLHFLQDCGGAPGSIRGLLSHLGKGPRFI
eukprot:s1591_g4.t4